MVIIGLVVIAIANGFFDELGKNLAGGPPKPAPVPNTTVESSGPQSPNVVGNNGKVDIRIGSPEGDSTDDGSSDENR